MTKSSISAPATKHEIQQQIGIFARAIIVTTATSKPQTSGSRWGIPRLTC